MVVQGSVMGFSTTFNNISVIPWWSVLLVEEIGVPGENLPQVIVQDFVFFNVYTILKFETLK